jgi:hypothetical protein
MSEPFHVAHWYGAMREAGQDVRAVDFIEHDLQLVVVGRSYDHARDAERWAPLVEHRTAVIEFLSARQKREEAA